MVKVLVLFLWVIGTPMRAEAMPDDHQKVANLSADVADLNQTSHRGEYTGHVKFDQGTTHLRAAKATTIGDEKNKLILAIVLGNKTTQAHFWTKPAADKPLLHAYADTIRYYPKRHWCELIGHARVQQGNNSFLAPQINYDTKKQHVVSKRDGQQRVNFIIHPEKKL